MKKRFLSGLVTGSMVLAMLPKVAFAVNLRVVGNDNNPIIPNNNIISIEGISNLCTESYTS